MGERGPKPKGPKLNTVKQTTPTRPSPPKGMTAKARSIWKRVVNSYAVDHFKPQHYDLLRMYCSACVMQKDAEVELFKKGSVITQINGVMKQNPYVDVAIKAEGSATRLATKLGITVNNTTVNRGIKGSVPQPKSKRGDLINRGQ